ncbi:hypothetical protein AHAS_Ahas20G0237000 [Arachis hypogaea]
MTVTMEDVTYILGLPVNGEPVTGKSDSSHQFLVENCIACFGREPSPQDHVLGRSRTRSSMLVGDDVSDLWAVAGAVVFDLLN